MFILMKGCKYDEPTKDCVAVPYWNLVLDVQMIK